MRQINTPRIRSNFDTSRPLEGRMVSHISQRLWMKQR